MDKLEQYRSALKKILTQYYEMTVSASIAPDGSEVTERLAFDEIRDQYLWFRFGWDGKKLVQQIVIYISLKNGKVWVESDTTNLGVVDDLLSTGIAQSDIVLGFHHPSKRALTDFATV